MEREMNTRTPQEPGDELLRAAGEPAAAEEQPEDAGRESGARGPSKREKSLSHADTDPLYTLDIEPEPAASKGILARLMEVNKELWLVLAILTITAWMNYLVTAKRMVVGFYTLPTLFSAYFFGRRHAVFTAFASVFLVGLLAYVNPLIFMDLGQSYNAQHDIIVWGGILAVTAYAMGTLHERERARLDELRQTYHGVIIMLGQLVCKDKFSQNHAYRVSVYATKIAQYRGLSPDRIEDVRAAALLHDIGNMDASRDLLLKAAQLTQEDVATGKKKARGAVHRLIPIIYGHRHSFDAPGYNALNVEVPLEARIIKVADAFDSLTSDKPSGKAVTPMEAKNIIARESGSEFDPTVVHAFKRAFRKGELERPEPAEQAQAYETAGHGVPS